MSSPERFYSISDITDPLSLIHDEALQTADQHAHPTRLKESLRYAEERLSDAGVPSPRVDAELLAAHVLGIDRGQLLAASYAGTVVPEKFWDLLTQREARVPLQHLTGRMWFRRLPLAVGPGVFIPRPETEDVAGAAISAAREVVGLGQAPTVVDLCAGSGAIALAVADEVPSATVHAVELDPMAANWAQHNINRLDAGVRVRLTVGDAAWALDEMLGQVDVVVSNPPYIPPNMEPVEPEVAVHDPSVALFGGGEDGLEVPRMIVHRAAQLLRPGGAFVMEHADNQQISMMRVLHMGGWSQVAGFEDLSGRPRYVTAIRPHW